MKKQHLFVCSQTKVSHLWTMWLPVWSNGNGVHIIKTTLSLFTSFSPRLGTKSHICELCETATSITRGNKNKWTFFL